MEAEYIAASEAAKEAVWIQKFITGLGVVPSITDPVDLYCDNNGAITQAKELSKSSQDKSWLWHKKLSHLNFKTMNELVKKELVRGIPQVEFTKDGLCDACQKGKQIKASFRKKLDSTIEEPLQLLHMDLFGPVNVLSISRKIYCLVIVDDFSKFS
ncbi:hypothetical protein AgCh_039331 [Apium graveolens]